MKCATCEKLLSPDQDAFAIKAVADDSVTHVVRFCSPECTRAAWNTAKTMQLPIPDGAPAHEDTDAQPVHLKRRVP